MIWNCANHKIEYSSQVLIMGILNVTPDSFSDGGQFNTVESAVAKAISLQNDGADIIDIGAQSTKPGANVITPEQEWARLESVLDALQGKITVPLSVDTFYPQVAQNALKYGVSIVNDVSGKFNCQMAKIVKESRCGYILMHNGAGDCQEVGEFCKKMLNQCVDFGIDKSQLCFDMGIGFGKTYEQNLSLIANIKSYMPPDVPILLGVSKKRVIGTASNQPNVSARIYGNIAAHTVGVLAGANIIRLHDVLEEKQGILTAQELKKWIK